MEIQAEGEIRHMAEAEHLLHRPDTLVGSTRKVDTPMHVFTLKPTQAPTQDGTGMELDITYAVKDDEQMVAVGDNEKDGDENDEKKDNKSDDDIHQCTVVPNKKKTSRKVFTDVSTAFQVEWKTLSVAPALINVVLEIVTNALDRQFRDSTMTKLEVWIDCEEAGGPGWVRVRNDGQGVPVVFDEDAGFYKPYMAFGLFRTGSNFDDAAEGARYTGGRNGYGCKATNVFSQSFKVDTADPRVKKRFQQTFSGNMGSFSEPRVTSYKSKKGYTDISFLLDFTRFGLPGGMDADAKNALTSVIVDASACSLKKVTMSLNNTPLGVRNLKDYSALFAGDGQHMPAYDFHKTDDIVTWEVCAVPALPVALESSYGFVNSLRCSDGTHMNLAFTRVCTALLDHLKKTYKRDDLKLSSSYVKQNLFIVVRIMVDSPEFTSQTKEKLSTPRHQFGFDWTPSAAFLKALVATGVADAIYHQAISREERHAKVSTSGRRFGAVVVEKYEGATNVKQRGSQCKLLLTEGDSAKQLALAGMAVVGRGDFGVFPLKGKLLNVRTASVAKLMANHEITSMMKILGLEYGKSYSSLDALRYKKLVIFSDQDPDGSHIAALILNFMHYMFPSVLVLDPNFVQRFATPIVRVTPKARTRDDTDHMFYAVQAFEQWVDQQDVDLSRYTTKYYKGLGTSTSAQAREYFGEYDAHIIDVTWEGADSDLMMAKFFGDTEGRNSGPAARRELLANHYDPADYVDYDAHQVSYSEFLSKEVLPFAAYANVRAIPSVIDGFKPSQRKVIHTFLKKNFVAEVKVAQVGSLVASDTAYHHGEVSLVETIVGMAQDHVGASNINLLRPEGQFGTRHDPPSVHAQPRYIFTGLDPVTRAIFPKADDPVLTYLDDEGQSIEPMCFAPIIPMALVNGSVGIGYGFSTNVPTYNPRDVLLATRAWISGGPDAVLDLMIEPWTAGHTGPIVRTGEQEYRTEGVFQVEGDTITITELPVGTWTNPYVTFLEEKLTIGSGASGGKSDSKPPKHRPFIRSIEKLWTDSTVRIELLVDVDAMPDTASLPAVLKMHEVIRESNMHMHDREGRLYNYSSPHEVVCVHAEYRLEMYTARKVYLTDQLEKELVLLKNRWNFVSGIVAETLVIHRLSDEAVHTLLLDHGFALVDQSYDYLLNMTQRATTQVKLVKLELEITKTQTQMDTLAKTTEKQLWLSDLDVLEAELEAFEERKRERYSNNVVLGKAKATGGKRKRARLG